MAVNSAQEKDTESFLKLISDWGIFACLTVLTLWHSLTQARSLTLAPIHDDDHRDCFMDERHICIQRPNVTVLLKSVGCGVNFVAPACSSYMYSVQA